jgi:putative tryptophan/tyrosine transport system substrate-binding protein
MKRRDFIAGLGSVAAWPLAARAQQPGRTYRIALLAPRPIVQTPPFSAFLEELKRSGITEGHNLLIDRRGTEIEVARFEAVAVELAETGPDAILAWGPVVVHAAQRATRSIPIIVFSDDPVESRLVASMSKPGGNTTGVGIFASQLDVKRLEILHEIVPAAKRIGILVDPTQIGRGEVEAAARNLGLELVTREARNT